MHIVKRLFALAASLALNACATTPQSHELIWPAADEPLGANEIVLTDSSASMLGNKANLGILQVRVRFTEGNYAYQVAFSASDHGAEPNFQDIYQVTVRFVDPNLNLDLEPFTFAGGQTVLGSEGREYIVSTWHWHAEHYLAVNEPDSDYATLIDTSFVQSRVKNILRGLPTWRETSGSVKPIGMYFTNRRDWAAFPGIKRRKANTLTGESALAAFEDPESIYTQYFGERHGAKVAEANRKKAAEAANQAYRTFIYQSFVQLTLTEKVKKGQCPSLPYMLRSYDPPAEWYRQGDIAVTRANCLTELVNSYDPTPLISAYERNLDQESKLYASTYGIERFSLEDALDTVNQVVRDIQIAGERAQALYDGGDYWSERNQQRKADQARQAQAMRGLVQGLQSLDQTLQAQNRQTEANVRRLQAQAFNRPQTSTVNPKQPSATLPQPMPMDSLDAPKPSEAEAEKVAGNTAQSKDAPETPPANTVNATRVDDPEQHTCWPPSPNCLVVGSEWSQMTEGRIIVTYRNACDRRIVVKKCNERADGSADCGTGGIRGGEAVKWPTSNATGRYAYNMIGVDNPNKDWVCMGRTENWRDQPLWNN